MSLALPKHDFRAFLFDCDGTIADSMPLHYVAWKRALAKHSVPFSEELFYEWGGRPVAEIIRTLNEQHGASMPVEELDREKEALYVELIPQLQAVPEVLEHVHAYHGKIPFAVVSGSPRDSVVRTLEQLGILHLFDTLVCAGEYTKGKPDPEPFLKAARELGVAPADCLVFEDADLGIQAAAAAGMQWVKVPLPTERGVAAGS